MRKHIGTRIIVMLVVLIVLFGISTWVSSSLENQTLNALEELGTTGMELQEQNTILAREVQECRLYGTMINSAESAQNLSDAVSEVVTRLDSTIERMKELCVENGDAEVLAALETYNLKFDILLPYLPGNFFV